MDGIISDLKIMYMEFFLLSYLDLKEKTRILSLQEEYLRQLYTSLRRDTFQRVEFMEKEGDSIIQNFLSGEGSPLKPTLEAIVSLLHECERHHLPSSTIVRETTIPADSDVFLKKKL